MFKLLAEFQILLINRRQFIFSDDRRQIPGLPHLRISREQLIRQILMILPGIPFTDTVLHQTGQRRQDTDRRIHRLAMQIPIQHDLPFRNVAGQIRDRMGNIVIGHGQDRQLGHGPVGALHDPCPLVNCGKLTI